jgi:sec-independent protein translocase protein TatC
MQEAQIRAFALFVLSLLAIAFVLWLLYRRSPRVGPSGHMMPFLEHVEELRIRVLRGGLVVVLWCVLLLSVRAVPFRFQGIRLAYPAPSLYDNVAAQVYHGLVRLTVPVGVTLFVSSPMEAVGAQMQVALILAIVVSMPFLLYETWAFFAPGLASRERRFVRSVLPIALVLFLIGSSFGILLVVPLLFAVLYAFAAPLGATTFMSAGELVGTVLTTALLFGAAFELPLVMVGAVRLGLLTTQSYLRKWRHATVAIFIVAAFASDPTLMSQLIIGTLLLALYWGGVLASMLVEHRQARAAPHLAKTT